MVFCKEEIFSPSPAASLVSTCSVSCFRASSHDAARCASRGMNRQAGRRRSDPTALFAEPAARASCAEYQIPQQHWFGWRRPAPAKRPADCGETAPVASQEAGKHQTLGREAASSIQERRQGARLLVRARAYLEEDQGQEAGPLAGARRGGSCDPMCAAPNRPYRCPAAALSPTTFQIAASTRLAGHCPARRLSISSTLATSPTGQTSCKAVAMLAKAGKLFRLACK